MSSFLKPTWFRDFYYTHTLTYAEAFAFRYVCTACVFGLIGMTAALCFGITSYLMKKSAKRALKKQTNVDSVDGSLNFDLDYPYQDAQTFLKEDQGNQKNSLWQKFLQVIAFISAWYTFFCFAIAPSILSGLAVIPVWSSVIITLLLFAIMYMIHIFWFGPNLRRSNPNTSTLLRKILITTSLYKGRFILFFTIAFIYSATVPLLTTHTCLNFSNQGYGTKFDTFGLSTAFSRYFQIKTVCPSGQICHLYATLPEDSATSAILNVHTAADVKKITIGYGVHSHKKITTNITAQSFYVDLEERGARYVHSAVLTGLEPNTTYYFEIYYNKKMQRNGTYLTLPSHKMERHLLIAAGGDAGTKLHSHKMTAALGEHHSPDAILVGGDLAYDNGIPACYYSLDLFLGMFEKLNEKFGRVIPLFFSVGNHDLGFNAFQDAKIDISKNLYYTYFPQQTKSSDRTKVPEIHKRTSYYYHTLGNTVHLSLDSGYMVKYDGIQEHFIKNISETYIDHVKMANYHVPMHPACFPNSNEDRRVMTEPAKYWAPLFEKYKFASVFENHVHLYKKTFPIANGKVQPEGKGVVYFGDGNWGVNPSHCLKGGNWNITGFMEVYSNENHIWMIQISKRFINHYAINRHGKVFDKVYKMNISNYI